MMNQLITISTFPIKVKNPKPPKNMTKRSRNPSLKEKEKNQPKRTIRENDKLVSDIYTIHVLR